MCVCVCGWVGGWVGGCVCGGGGGGACVRVDWRGRVGESEGEWVGEHLCEWVGGWVVNVCEHVCVWGSSFSMHS